MVETAFLAAAVEMLAERPAAAAHKLQWAYETCRPTGQMGYVASLAAALSEALEVLGRLDEAEALTGVSEQAAGEDDLDSQARWRQVRAKTLARRGDFQGAEILAHEAVKRIADTDALNMRAASLVDLAEVLGRSGQMNDARATAQQAVELYAQKGNLIAEKRVEGIAENLRAGRVPVARAPAI